MNAGTISHAFEVLAESCGALVFVTDLGMRMQYASSLLEVQTGFTAADFQFPQQDNPFIHREDAEQVADTLAMFVADTAQLEVPIENRFVDRWGRVHHYRSVVTKFEYAGAPALLFVCRQLATATASAEDDRQYRALVDATDDAILRLDTAGRILFANRRTYELLGYSAIELGRSRLDDIVAGDDRSAITATIARSIGITTPVPCALRLVTGRGGEISTHGVFVSLGTYGQIGELLAILRADR